LSVVQIFKELAVKIFFKISLSEEAEFLQNRTASSTPRATSFSAETRSGRLAQPHCVQARCEL
ncbi:hypothetical protein, partial [Denitromonas sp.]|uniref:hypothetical protein n=1 Tax=Denitromonas sp. TaxID=2734609 RepID=UPI003A8C29A5